MQRRLAVLVPYAGTPAAGQNCPEHVQGTGRCREVHRRSAIGIRNVRTYAPGQQAPHFLDAGLRMPGERAQAAFLPRPLGHRGWRQQCDKKNRRGKLPPEKEQSLVPHGAIFRGTVDNILL